MAGPFELEFGFFGQRQQLDEISAWTCESGDRETGISPVTRTWPTESSSKIKELFLFKTSAYLVQADGIYNLKNAYVANFAFCPPCFKNKFKIHSFQWMADYFLWFLSLWQMFLSYFLAVTVLLPCAGCIVPVCFLIIMVRTDGNLQPATGVSVLLWCLRHSAAVKDGACLHQLQWSFTCLQKDPNHLLAIYICQYTAKNKQQTAHGWQPFLFLEVRHFWHLWMEVGSFFWKKNGFSIPMVKTCCSSSTVVSSEQSSDTEPHSEHWMGKVRHSKHTTASPAYRLRDTN